MITIKHFIFVVLLYCCFVVNSKAVEKYIIGNSYITKTISIDNGYVVGGKLLNNIIGEYIDCKGEEFIISLCSKDTLYCSELIIKDVEKKGNETLTIEFSPIEKGEVLWKIDLIYELPEANASFLYKYLKVGVLNDSRERARIDYIDIDCFDVSNLSNNTIWSRPDMAANYLMKGYYLGLGQPIYANSFFFGSEFPEADNRIIDGFMHSRYYCGKSLLELGYSNSLDDKGFYRTWNNVVGVSHSSTDFNVVRKDFFFYLNKIKRPSGMRLQYNSWYDWYMTISSEKILDSFKKMENGFTRSGLRPIDAYVLDNGWNAYANISDENSTPNTGDFWMFNDKFPSGLYYVQDYINSVCSTLGLWMSPRGGYSYVSDWARYLEGKGTGTYNENSGDLVTGDSVYLSRMLDFLLENQEKYGLTYWKLDGFALATPQPSKNGRYITGGYENMYYVTEHWERWIEIFKKLYKKNDEKGLELWLNLTGYVNPSPWLLQFSNSIYIQGDHDSWDEVVDGRNIKMETQLNYRDDVYFYNNDIRQWQFPINQYFHHDPCFGKAAFDPYCSNDNEFRMYLYMIAMRGAGLWDMLYSSELMDIGNRWLINAEVLQFAEENENILKNSIIFGRSPKEGHCYGYSAWDPETSDGIVALRNPSNIVQQFGFRLTSNYGVPETKATLYQTLVMDYLSPSQLIGQEKTYHYGDSLSFELAPGEVMIFKYSSKRDLSSPEIDIIQANSPNIIRVKFSEKIHLIDKNNVQLGDEDMNIALDSLALKPNQRDLYIYTNKPLSPNKYELQLSGVQDYSGNVSDNISSEFFAYPDSGLILNMDSSIIESGMIPTKYIEGKGDFSVHFLIQTDENNLENFLYQKDAFDISLTDGKLKFRVGNSSVKSDVMVNDNLSHSVSCCREANGMLRIYVDGKLKSAFDKDNVDFSCVQSVIQISTNASCKLKKVEIYNKSKETLLSDETEGSTDISLKRATLNNSFVVVDLTGRFIFNGVNNNRLESLKKGIYIVIQNGKSRKVVIN